MMGIGTKKAISCAVLVMLFFGALPLVSGRVGVYIGPSIEGNVRIMESAGVDSSNPDTPSTSLAASSSGKYTFVKIDLSKLPPIDEIYIVSAYLGFGFSGWHGAGEWGYASIATHYCDDDSWSASTLTWNNKPDHKKQSTDTWGFSMFYYGSPSLGFTIEDDVEEGLKAGDTVLTEVVTWGSGTGGTSLSGPSIRVTYAKRPVYTVSMDTQSDVPEIKVLASDFASVKVSDRGLWWSGEEGIEDFCASPGTYDLAFSGRCKFVGWETGGGVSVSNPSEPSTQITINSDGNLILRCSLDYILYGEMTDKPSSYASDVAYNASQKYAARHIPILPVYLRLVRIYIAKNPEPVPFELHILGMSEDPIKTPPVDIAAPIKVTLPIGVGWVEVDLTPQQIKVEKDTAFYVSVTWLYDKKPTLGGASMGYGETFVFKDGKWSTTSDGALIQVIVSRTLEEPVKFTTATTTTKFTTPTITTSPKPPTTTKETTITRTTPPSPTTRIIPPTTYETTVVTPPKTTIETTVTVVTPTTTLTLTPPPSGPEPLALFIIFLGVLLVVAGVLLIRGRRKKREIPYLPPPPPPI